MPQRSKRVSTSRTPSPKKKPSPIKKLLLRRTSQTPERSIYQIVQAPRSTTFLEESYDETTPSPPPIERKEDKSERKSNGNEFKRVSEKRLNAFGLEESADNESESDKEEKVVQKLKKKKKTMKKSRKSKPLDMFDDLNSEIIANGLEGVKTIQAVTSLLDQSFTSYRKKSGDISKASGSSLTSSLNKETIDETKMDIEEKKDVDMLQQDENVGKVSRTKSKPKKASNAVLQVPKLSAEEETEMDIEEDKDLSVVQDKASTTKSKSKRTSNFESSMPKLSPMVLPPTPGSFDSSSTPKSSLKNDKKNDGLAMSEDSFEIIIEESAVKTTVVEDLTNLKLEDNVKAVKADIVLSMGKVVEQLPKSKSKPKKKLTPKREESSKSASTSDFQHANNDLNVEEAPMDIVSNVVMDKAEPKRKSKPIVKAKRNQKDKENSPPKILRILQSSIDANMEAENVEPQISKHESELPSTSTINQSNGFSSSKLSTFSPFTFTPEQLERFKSQQLPAHESILNGPVGVKLVPQNRSSAPVFLQISQKDFRRMLPKLPQQQQTNAEKL
uniref:Uncharacterized protein n=1 Tax=Panagrolaimus sp. PS1159 TaxID=55785 RepID=A0AC35FAN4_9BILA